MVAQVEVEVEVVGVVPLTLPMTEVEVAVEALKVLRREGLEVEEGTFYLVAVEGLLRLAWTEVAVEGRRWELSKVVEAGRPFLGQEEEGGLSYAEGGEGAEALPWTVVEVAVLAFVVHF